MSAALQRVEPVSQQVLARQEDLDLLHNTIAPKNATVAEIELFAAVCRRKGLDPISKQIYLVKRGNDCTFQVGIDGFRLIAERTGRYEGQDGPWWCGEDGDWKSVWVKKEPPAAARVGVFKSGFRDTLWGVAHYREFSQQNNSMWSRMPANQLAKCAEAAALRKAFPEELGGLYGDEEMDQADSAPETTMPFRKPARGAEAKKAAPAAATRDEITHRVTNLRTECVALMGQEPGLAAFTALLGQHGAKTFAELLRRNDGFEAALRFAAELDERLETFRTAAAGTSPAEVTEDRSDWIPDFGPVVETEEAQTNV